MACVCQKRCSWTIISPLTLLSYRRTPLHSALLFRFFFRVLNALLVAAMYLSFVIADPLSASSPMEFQRRRRRRDLPPSTMSLYSNVSHNIYIYIYAVLYFFIFDAPDLVFLMQ